MPLSEREITESVDLAGPTGLLNPQAVGWTRMPLHRTDSVTHGLIGRTRTKRWEYWAITTPTHAVGLVVSDISYASTHGIFVLDRRTGEQISHDTVGLPGAATLPGTLGEGVSRSRTRTVQLEFTHHDDATHLSASGPRVRLEVTAHRPPGHQSLGVVVPWSQQFYQYTVKDLARPATGTLWVDGVPHELPAAGSWATVDHGRGRWHRDVRWNWGAGTGTVAGRTVGIQVGGQWTAGTGSTENAVLVDGRLSKISAELQWAYDPQDWLAPWRVRGEGVDLLFTPEHLRRAVTDLGVISSRTHQCFGVWSGRVRLPHGETLTLTAENEVYGWAEDVHQRW